MPKKIVSLIFISLALFMLLNACERPYSIAPINTPIDGNITRTALPVDQQILNATMTAQAIMQKFDQPTAIIELTEEKPEETPAQSTTEGTTEVSPAPTDTGATPEPTTISTQPQASTTLPPTPVVIKPAVYTVHEGEFVYCLSRRFDVHPTDLLTLNGLDANSMLSAGMELKIPTTGSFPGDRFLLTHPDTWTVDPGDTIYKIACEYGDLYPESIIAVNGLVEPYDLTVGQKLQIP